MSPLPAWETFYVIIGSSAAALTGLQFVVIALIAESRARSSSREIEAFGSPTVVHFCAVLLVSAILSAPWRELSNVGLVLGMGGASGVAYVALVVRRARRQTAYRPVLEDWLWHAVFPAIAYAALLVAAVILPRDPAPALFGIAAAALLLLFVGIHNAWDAVTFVAVERWRTPKQPGDEESVRVD
ncbi:MAG: hypothetical protein M3547_02625 [Acidobacteriota bacterium]|nr:hypothetical protein [Acidobacteriota bacterium]